jgi:hypothetical protein
LYFVLKKKQKNQNKFSFNKKIFFSYSVVECNVELLPVILLIAVDGEKQDVREKDDRSDSDNFILRLDDFSLRISNVTSGLIDIIARAIDVPKLGRR